MYSLSIISIQDMKIKKEIIFTQKNINQYTKHIFVKDQKTILCGLNYKNIRKIDLNDFNDQNLKFSKDLGIHTIYIDKKNSLFLANQSYEIESYLLLNTNELKYTFKGHTAIIYEMDQMKENNLLSCGHNEIIIWNSITGE